MDWTWFKGRARMIFALLAGIVFMVVKAVFPQIPFTETQTVGFFALLSAYILGEGLSGGQINQNLKDLFSSQKFQAMLAGLLTIFAKQLFPQITDEMISGVLALLGTFIVGAGAQTATLKSEQPKG